jgi:hypothetical protein
LSELLHNFLKTFLSAKETHLYLDKSGFGGPLRVLSCKKIKKPLENQRTLSQQEL